MGAPPAAALQFWRLIAPLLALYAAGRLNQDAKSNTCSKYGESTRCSSVLLDGHAAGPGARRSRGSDYKRLGSQRQCKGVIGALVLAGGKLPCLKTPGRARKSAPAAWLPAR